MNLFQGLLLLLLVSAATAQAQYDLLILNGRVLDGAGAPWSRADVAIRGDEIVAVGRLAGATAERTLDAGGAIVAPGFIDIHNHSRRRILDVPSAENYIRQGVTTIVEGNDGGSPLPLREFFGELRERRISVNYASFVGHGSVRTEIVGMVDRPATAGELESMRGLVKQAMEDGAFGLSTGLFYLPGAFASTEEVIELAKVAAPYGGMHISHMRDEGAGLLESVRETIEIGEKGGLPTQITHHKAIGKPNWGKSTETLRLVEEARARGVDVSIDQYPYTASQTGSAALFPPWAQEGGREKMLERFADPDTRRRIRNDVANRIRIDRGGGDAANVQLAACEFDPSLNGKTLADAMRRAGREPSFEAAAETAIEIQGKGGCRTVYHAMDEQDVRRIMAYPGTMIASDGGVTSAEDGVPHPRHYGTFPRVLGVYVREQELLTLPDAVRKMTSLPAQRLGLTDRGLIRPGMKADLVVFDPEKIVDRAEFGDPHKHSGGIIHVVVNGTPALADGEMQPDRPGKILLGPGANLKQERGGRE